MPAAVPVKATVPVTSLPLPTFLSSNCASVTSTLTLSEPTLPGTELEATVAVLVPSYTLGLTVKAPVTDFGAMVRVSLSEPA